jgi:hypothetical protein
VSYATCGAAESSFLPNLVFAGATPETVYVSGKFCNIKSTIMMNCMRKQMLLV